MSLETWHYIALTLKSGIPSLKKTKNDYFGIVFLLGARRKNLRSSDNK